MSNDVTYANSYQDSIVAKWLDILSRESGYGTARGIHADILAGINARGFGTMLPHNNDHSGLTFFTRPRCNLSYDNLSASRVLSPLMTDKRMSYQAYIRDILDPVSVQRPGRKNCPLIDPRQAFIPIMSNLLMNVSGFPDIVSSCWTSNPGLYQEEYSLPDGPVKLYNTFDITCNFRNIDGDPLTGLFMAWREYYGLSYEGTVLPHTDAIVEDEVDFFTAIYRLVTNRDMTHVQKIARTIAYPISINVGSAFNYDVNALRDAVGIVLQKNLLFSGTIRDNLKWGDPDATDDDLWAACRAAHADEFLSRMPDGLDTDLGQGGCNVSGGQKQRLCIARTLLKHPKVLIFDDSTSAVDTATESGIRHALAGLGSVTKLIIAQRITSVQSADLIVILDDGRLHAVGTHDELLAKDTIYQEIYHSQMKGGDADGEVIRR